MRETLALLKDRPSCRERGWEWVVATDCSVGMADFVESDERAASGLGMAHYAVEYCAASFAVDRPGQGPADLSLCPCSRTREQQSVLTNNLRQR